MIYISHGIVLEWRRERISHALFLPEWLAAMHFQRPGVKYVSLRQALAGHGDALTVDDATYGGFKLALLARQYGHAVSWFVNGSCVAQGLQYYPFQISSLVDDARVPECRFDGLTWNLRSMGGRRALRLRVKETYMRLRTQIEIERLVDTLADCLHLSAAVLERSLSTVTPMELVQARNAGVDLQNHSWSHLNLRLLSREERTADMMRNDEYLSQFGEMSCVAFAPPFGAEVSLASAPLHFMLLADRKLNPGYREGNVVNRGDLVLNLVHISEMLPRLAEVAEIRQPFQ
jgi:peptidoglycan/xylan/chitin deacetylase (PgdA/CDA1 family)